MTELRRIPSPGFPMPPPFFIRLEKKSGIPPKTSFRPFGLLFWSSVEVKTISSSPKVITLPRSGSPSECGTEIGANLSWEMVFCFFWWFGRFWWLIKLIFGGSNSNWPGIAFTSGTNSGSSSFFTKFWMRTCSERLNYNIYIIIKSFKETVGKNYS